MKLKITILTTFAAGIIIFASWRVQAGTENVAPISARVENGGAITVKEVEEAKAMQSRIERHTSDVRNRLHMAAAVSVGDDPGEEEEIAELYRSGWIIDATVDEVEAAQKAAAATPSLEDDVAAKILAHRASCRFFLPQRK